MDVDVHKSNCVLQELLKGNKQDIFIDANIIIPPDRKKLGAQHAFDFHSYKSMWLIPIRDHIKTLYIHESAMDEIVEDNLRDFIVSCDSNFIEKSNSELSPYELYVMGTYIDKLSVFSEYNPEIDNSKDRGEILTLSYMATKGYSILSSCDGLVMNLIEKLDSSKTNLIGMKVLHILINLLQCFFFTCIACI